VIIYYTDNFTGGREESRRLLEKALAVHTGDEKQAKTLTGALKKGEHGKPYIEGFSCFSISHTGSIWAVLIADNECGLDIQLSRRCDFKGIAKRWYAPEDAVLIISSDDAAKAQKEFFRIWTRREALTKALGRTVYDPDLPAVSDDDLNVGGCDCNISDIDIPGMTDLHAAMCVYNNKEKTDLKFIRL
jgi:phosphopantetheinyl transferase